MNTWVQCSGCGLRHSVRGDLQCPRCHAPDPGVASGPAAGAAAGAASAAPAAMPPAAPPPSPAAPKPG